MSTNYNSNYYNVRLLDSRDGQKEVSLEENDLFFFYGNTILNILKGSFVPFVNIGAGWSLHSEEACYAFNYGGGLKFFITEKVALRIDACVFSTKHKGKIEQVIGLDRYTNKFLEEEFNYTNKLSCKEITIGISYLFVK